MEDWKTDKNGRRYRLIGQGCVEYAEEIITTHGIVPGNTVVRVKDVTPPKKEKVKTCPFQHGIPCRQDCALWKGNGCGIASRSFSEGGICPFTVVPCNPDCGLYGHGRCVLFG